MNNSVKIDFSDFERIMKNAVNFGDDAENQINKSIRSENVKHLLIGSITDITPVSNRNKKHAKSSQPYAITYGNLSATVTPRKKFAYLYFPDDGSNTERHQGNQHFMLHGAENARPKVIDTIVKDLVSRFNEEN